MIIMFKTTNYDNDIEVREITRVTDSCVFYLGLKGKEERELKETNYHVWHDTKEAAILHLKNKWIREIECAEARVLSVKKKLQELDNL